MKLLIKIESGSRAGKFIDISMDFLTQGNDIKNRYILETESVSFFLQSRKYYDSVELVLENIHYEFLYDGESIDGEYCYNLKPKKQNNGELEQLFKNYFGVASLVVVLIEGIGKEFKQLPDIEILAKKISAVQAEKMIRYIASGSGMNFLDVLGATRLGARSVGNGDDPTKLLEQLIIDIKTLEELTPYIVNKPLYSVSTNLTHRSGKHVEVIQEDGLSWLMENTAVLEETDSLEEAHVLIDDSYYVASELQTSELIENTDIYENRVIHAYIKNLLEYIAELRGGMIEYSHQPRNKHDGYVSFFAAMNELISKNSKKDIAILEECQTKLIKMEYIYQKYIPVNGYYHEIPRISEKIKANKHYLLLYRTMIFWYRNNEINWESRKFLLAITAIPKLFELYNLLRIREWCIKNSSCELESAENIVWMGEIGGNTVELFYEPVYWMKGHPKCGSIVNSENRSIDAALKDSQGLTRGFNRNSHRSPDFVLKKTTRDDKKTLVILDAKYSTPKLAFTKYLPECTMKYVHGISGLKEGGIVTSMIILHPDMNDVFRDFHVSEFGVFSEKPQIPILGAQGILFGDGEYGLDKLLSSLMQV